MTTFINKKTNETIKANLSGMKDKSTKNIYIRTGKTNGTLFLSERNKGENGTGDICRIDADIVYLPDHLFNRVKTFASK